MKNNKTARHRESSAVGDMTFNLYIVYLCSFFLHFTARLPALGIIRADLIIVIIISLSIMAKQNLLKGRFSNPCGNTLSNLFIYLAISLPFVEWPGSVIQDNLAEFLKAIVFFYFTVSIIDSRKRLKIFIFVFIACQIIRILEPLYLYKIYGFTGERTYIGAGEFAGRLGGAPSDVINPNGLGFVIATVIPFMHYLWGTSTTKWKVFYYSLIPPFLYALVLTLSRSGFVALLVIAWNIFIKTKNKSIFVVIFAVIAVIGWTQMSDLQKDRYMSITFSKDAYSTGTAKARLDGWSNNFETALTRPIVGHGVGTSQEATFNTRGGKAKISHILYLEIFIEMGLIGFCFYMLFIKSIYTMLRSARLGIETTCENSEDFKNKRISDDDFRYDDNLLTALNACFWMYIVFSFAQYGVSQYHWYFLAGIVVVVNNKINQAINIMEK